MIADEKKKKRKNRFFEKRGGGGKPDLGRLEQGGKRKGGKKPDAWKKISAGVKNAKPKTRGKNYWMLLGNFFKRNFAWGETIDDGLGKNYWLLLCEWGNRMLTICLDGGEIAEFQLLLVFGGVGVGVWIVSFVLAFGGGRGGPPGGAHPAKRTRKKKTLLLAACGFFRIRQKLTCTGDKRPRPVFPRYGAARSYLLGTARQSAGRLEDGRNAGVLGDVKGSHPGGKSGKGKC